MGRLLDVDELVTAGVIVNRMGLARIQRVHEMMRLQTPMPRPVYVGPRILLWHWPEVSAWAAASNRPALDPDDWVPAGLIGERLGLSDEDLRELTGAARRDVNGRSEFRWFDAEMLWIERTNRPRT